MTGRDDDAPWRKHLGVGVPSSATKDDGDTCAACNGRLVWAFSDNGKEMAFDAEPVEGVALLRNARTQRVNIASRIKIHTPHRQRCATGANWR